MAFVTQRQFLNIAFTNEPPKLPNRKRSDAVLKSYSSTQDTRAWSLDALKQSQFIGDVANRALSAAGKVPLHSFSGAELTKDMLVRLDASNLADYIFSLREEVKQKSVTIETLREAKENLTSETEVLKDKLHKLDEENRLLGEDIERIAQCQERQREAVQFDEQELAEISQLIIDLRERNEALEAAESSTEDGHVDRPDLEAENNFLKFRAQDYDRLENELSLFKGECESLTQQKRDLALELQRAQAYRARLMESKKELQKEVHRREMLEEQIEMLVTMYEQQAVELNQTKDQLRAYSRGSKDRLFDESTDEHNESDITIAESRSQTEASKQILESTTCQNCSENVREIEDLKEQIEFLQQELTKQEARNATLERVDSDGTVFEQQIEGLQRELANCQWQLKEMTAKYDTLHETSLADCQELGRLKLQLEQMTTEDPKVTVADGQKDLIEWNEKLGELQNEKENIQIELANSLSRITELEEKLQSVASAPVERIGFGECCQEKANKITELEQVISGLEDVPTIIREPSSDGEMVALREENASLQQVIASLQRKLDETETFPADQLSSLRAEVSQKNDTIEQLLQRLENANIATSTAEERACREELAELRVRLEAYETGAEDKRSRSVSDRNTIDQFEPLSPKEKLGDDEEEKETAEIKQDPAETDDDAEEGDEAEREDEAEGDDVQPHARMSESVEKLEELAYEMKLNAPFQQNGTRRNGSSVGRKCSLSSRASRECECIQRIAAKIAEDGLEGLLVAELYVLLQEICGAITRRNAILGRNVTVLANSMTKCWQVITDARVMMNMELMDRSNHREQLLRHASIIADLNEADDNRLSYDIGHLQHPPLRTSVGMPMLHKPRAVSGADNRQMAPNSMLQRQRTIRWMDNVKKPRE